MKLYGIPNCDTVKKARTWLTGQGHEYDWHDFKKEGVDAALLQSWVNAIGWEPLLNRQGTTWRKLDDATQAGVTDAASAIAVMQANPSVIKRPVLDRDGKISVGFKPEQYQTLFAD
ncbi:ArsC family reductase [Amantichitinum ursilacus]|uniref:Regulatory protein Spx n=1 Tax=Amantichitinum ursilacus TaxID=857265 RepID=A0A0N1JSR7_9NEIS|nr:ArsC family reductase [Amantichitinum ursilacus]KPC52946.1 Regulatory protein Spx [Amantichitinum ursilacus]